MPRQKKEYSPVSIKMDKAVYNELNIYCEESGVPKTTVIERAVTRYIEKQHEDMKVRGIGN